MTPSRTANRVTPPAKRNDTNLEKRRTPPPRTDAGKTPTRGVTPSRRAPKIQPPNRKAITPSLRTDSNLERQRTPTTTNRTVRPSRPNGSGADRTRTVTPIKRVTPIQTRRTTNSVSPGSRLEPGSRVTPGSRAPGSRSAGDPLNPLSPIDRDRLNERRIKMTKIPNAVGPGTNPKRVIPTDKIDGAHKRDRNRDTNGDRDRDGDWGDHDRDGDRDDRDHRRDNDCYRTDHSHCDHGFWHWDSSWGSTWSHRTLYRYHWFAGSHFYDYDGYGLYFSYHGSRYYNPWYRTNTVVYVSTRYVGHTYYGVDHDSTGDAAVFALEQGWESLEYGDWTTARRRFARASSLAPQWGLPRIGYALASAAGGNTQSAHRLMEQAFERDPYAALEIPWTDAIVSVISDLEAYYTDSALAGYQERDNWFMAATLRLMLNDPDGAADAAFTAESFGNTSDSLQGLLDVLAAQEWAQP